MSDPSQSTILIIVVLAVLLCLVFYTLNKSSTSEKFTTNYARSSNDYPYTSRGGGREGFKDDYTVNNVISKPVTDYPHPSWVGFNRTTQNPFVGEITGEFGPNPKQYVDNIWKSVDGL